MRIGDEWLLTPCRMALHLPTATGVLADLHLGYEQARRRSGDAIPEIRIEDILDPLHPILQRHAVRQLVVAGDLFESRPHIDLVRGLLRWLAAEGVTLTVVPGNHDRGIADISELNSSVRPEGERVGRWLIVHGDQDRPPGPVVQGHEHPWFQWDECTSAPCYLVQADHLVLPAYSKDARGGNVLGQARWSTYRCGVVVGEEVVDFGTLKRIQLFSRETPASLRYRKLAGVSRLNNS